MLIFDQLRKNDPQLRLLALVVFAALSVLFAGLWWVQVVRARDYQAHLETQSFRTVRTPAMRGKILDRNDQVLAENRPNYNVSLYFEDLRKPFEDAYHSAARRLRAQRESLMAEQERKLGRKLTKQERRAYVLGLTEKNALRATTRYDVASNVVAQINLHLHQPSALALDPTNFHRHYATRLALPYPVLKNLDPAQIALFQEQFAGGVGAELEIQSTRTYPFGATASHVLGYLRRDDSSVEGEEAFFSYWLPDFRGVVGIEGRFDRQLRGRAGGKSVLVNNLGYRQNENVWAAAEPGQTVVLTLDVRIQQEAERALRQRVGQDVRGAVVVMDVRNGDILALVSAPAADPNNFIRGFPTNEIARWNDNKLGMQKNRATQEQYQAGSIFKTVVALAALEAGFNPDETYTVAPNPKDSAHGIIYVGRQPFRDLAPPGDYDFRRALLKSSNAYFINCGLHTGIEKIAAMGHRLHLGERCDLPTMQETPGIFPSLKRISANWRDGDTANLCIGQGEIAVTPLQMAVLTSALANDGKVLTPRLVTRIEPQDTTSPEAPMVFPEGRVRGELGLRVRSLDTLRKAMLADTEDPEGTAYNAFRERGRNADNVKPMRVCGKTGTAQKKDKHGQLEDHITWFISFAPYEKPRYAVVVMVESGGSGGGTCAPVARDIYTAIQKLDTGIPEPSLARTQ
jgi:penicillin-binding protein 2